MDLNTANTVIAYGTAAASIGAVVSAIFSAIAACQAKSIATKEIEAMLTAAKANALASRIDFYGVQIGNIEKQFENWKTKGETPDENAGPDLKEFRLERDHLAFWLDRQTDKLGVGLRFECPGSPSNKYVGRWRQGLRAIPSASLNVTPDQK